jgi:hypothetical protein
MTPAMIVNLGIITLIAVGMALTTNPLCMMALFFLRDMTADPMALMQAQMQAMQQAQYEDPEDGQPMGFTADVK